MTWLLDTLVWTGALIALVLVARRPVARQFGAKAAYSLWLLPLARLALPPIVLPSWLAPAASPDPGVVTPAVLGPLPVNGTAIATAPAPGFEWQQSLVALWFAGAVIYIVLRLVSYARLRRELLAEARPVGFAGRIRLLETRATASPLAFGVIDKVVALPPGFMAWPDRRARDLALAHELAHHRAHDLAFNFLALPLFALHWFSPLSLLGWRAMRRDQEAACDARVIEHRDRADRAAYAMLIASAVAGPRGALAAPMACPVLGDKSIVHRLRNLTMTSPSTNRRRAGALLIGASLLLVPLTASISYAQDEASEPPLPPAAPVAPYAPLPPEAPLPQEVAERALATPPSAPDGSGRERRVVIVRPGEKHADGSPRIIERRIIRSGPDGEFDEKALEKELEDLDKRLGNLDADIERSVELATHESARAGKMAALAVARAPRVVMDCDRPGNLSESTATDGKRVIRICHKRIAAGAVTGLRSVRARIAEDDAMSEETRNEVLRSLDREIERMEREN